MRISDWISDVCSSDLSALGYRAFGWGLGHNFSLRTIGADGEKLGGRIAAIAEETGEPVTLIGVSLGGIMARFAAQRWPDQVREVITVASPFAGNPRATNLWLTYEWLTGERVDSPRPQALLAEADAPLPVPATAIWSRRDGLVNGMICHEIGRASCRERVCQYV